MKVILKEDVNNLGKKDELVSCKDGYARNYLIPRNLAMYATEKNIKNMKHRRKVRNAKIERRKEKAEKTAETLSEKTVTIKAKAGEKGKLFGSITNSDVAERIEKQFNISIDKKKIEMEDNIKTIGEHKVTAKIYAGIDTEFTVEVKEK